MYIDGTKASEGFKVKLLDKNGLWPHKPWIIKSGDSLIASIDRNFPQLLRPLEVYALFAISQKTDFFNCLFS